MVSITRIVQLLLLPLMAFSCSPLDEHGDEYRAQFAGNCPSGPYYVHQNVFFRTGPGSTYDAPFKVSSGTQIESRAESPQGGWYPVRVNNTDGWMHGDYLMCQPSRGGNSTSANNGTAVSGSGQRGGAPINQLPTGLACDQRCREDIGVGQSAGCNGNPAFPNEEFICECIDGQLHWVSYACGNASSAPSNAATDSSGTIVFGSAYQDFSGNLAHYVLASNTTSRPVYKLGMETMQIQVFGTDYGIKWGYYQAKNHNWEEFFVANGYIYRYRDISEGADMFYALYELQNDGSLVKGSKWLPTGMSVGQCYSNPRNYARHYWKSDCSVRGGEVNGKEGNWAWGTKVIAHHRQITFPDGVKINNVIELAGYIDSACTARDGASENFYYAYGMGLIGWGINGITNRITAMAPNEGAPGHASVCEPWADGARKIKNR